MKLQAISGSFKQIHTALKRFKNPNINITIVVAETMFLSSISLLCILLVVLQVLAKKPCPGASAKAGDTVNVHYDGFIDKSSAAGQHDKLFDSSHKRGKPFKFTLGAGQVIQGWDEG